VIYVYKRYSHIAHIVKGDRLTENGAYLAVRAFSYCGILLDKNIYEQVVSVDVEKHHICATCTKSKKVQG
jgi:hypothetical protein